MQSIENLHINPSIQKAIANGEAVVALESALITHGLPKPLNLEVAKELESIIRESNAIPATIGIISGQIVVGLNDSQLDFFS